MMNRKPAQGCFKLHSQAYFGSPAHRLRWTHIQCTLGFSLHASCVILMLPSTHFNELRQTFNKLHIYLQMAGVACSFALKNHPHCKYKISTLLIFDLQTVFHIEGGMPNFMIFHPQPEVEQSISPTFAATMPNL